MIIFLKDLMISTNKAFAIFNKAVTESNILDQIIKLLEVVIWPLTVFAGLLLFRKHFSRLINSLGSIKAGAQGFEMNFIEDKLQEATELIGMGSSAVIPKEGGIIIPKDGASIIPKDGSGIIPKSGTDVTPNRNHADSPYQELIELEDAIRAKLINIAQQNGISLNNSSNFALTNDLSDRDLINSHTAHKLKMLIELNTMGLNTPKTTHNQVKQMKKLFNNITF